MALAGRAVCMGKACAWDEVGDSCPVPQCSLSLMFFSAQHASVTRRAP